MTEIKKVAVIGAGPAGLITASELIRAGLDVVILEQREVIGGTWALQPIPDAPDIRDNNRTVFSATYPGMRINFPRQLMGFSYYPCDDSNLLSSLIFPSHQQMYDFLVRFAQKQGITSRMRYNHQLKKLHFQVRNGRDCWLIETEQQGILDEPFDAILFCTGRYSEPVIPEIPGIKEFTGKVIHSLSYRGPEPYRGQRVAVLGTGPSGEDTSRQISKVADRVFVCARVGSYPFLNKMEGSYGPKKNITRQEDIVSFKGNQILLTNGKVLKDIDTLILSTGYQIHSRLFANVPFLSVIDDEQSLWPLYLHMFHPKHPTLGVIGLPKKTVPFILFEYQAQLAAGFLSGKIKLPSHKAMMYACSQMYLRNQNLECIHEFEDYGQRYYQTLAALLHRAAPPESLIALFDIQRAHRRQYPEDYRDIDHPAFI